MQKRKKYCKNLSVINSRFNKDLVKVKMGDWLHIRDGQHLNLGFCYFQNKFAIHKKLHQRFFRTCIIHLSTILHTKTQTRMCQHWPTNVVYVEELSLGKTCIKIRDWLCIVKFNKNGKTLTSQSVVSGRTMKQVYIME